MSDLLKHIDARTKLAGTNKLEILLFTLGQDSASVRSETFGINVFKVREVMRAPAITRAPEMPAAVEGMVSLRGSLVPVIDLARNAGITTTGTNKVMIVTEYNGHTQGFLVQAVDTILRVDWSVMKVPPAILTNKTGGLVTAITELENGRLVMMIDVEKVLAEAAGLDDDATTYHSISPLGISNRTVLYADDSSIARRQIEKTLAAMDVQRISTNNGQHAWNELERIAERAAGVGKPASHYLQLILTDVEMPEMDGYMLTRKIKKDPRFAGIPVIMHSSLSGDSNRQLGMSVGVDDYVSKFEPRRLAETLTRLLA
jgi:two-component system chemotaxis response regulator CheV